MRDLPGILVNHLHSENRINVWKRGKTSPVSRLGEKRMAGDATPKETQRCGVFPTLRAVSLDRAPGLAVRNRTVLRECFARNEVLYLCLLKLFCSRLVNLRCWRVELLLARLRWLTGLAICIPGGDSILSAQENRMGIGPGIVCVGGAVVADDFPIG